MQFGISRPHMDQDVEKSLRLLPSEIQTAIDLGCGMGKLGKIAKTVFPNIKITGIDGNPDVIKALWESENNPYDEVRYALIQNILPILPKSDLIMMGDVLEHLNRNQLSEIIQLVRSRCRFALTVGPEQTEEELKRSFELRNNLPTLETHLSSIQGEEIASFL